MGLSDFWKECVSLHHGIRAAQEWVEQNGGSDFEVSESTLESLAQVTGAQDTEHFIEGWDYAMRNEARKEDARAQGGWRAFWNG
jgi:hypothetical protein